MTEREIIQGCKRGNVGCQRLLYEKYYNFVMSICLRYTNIFEDAEDYSQDVLIKVFTKINEYRFQGSFLGWIKRICINYMLNIYREKGRMKNSAILVELDENIDESIYVQDVEVSMEIIMEMIRQLSDGYRQVFNLIVIDDFSCDEVAKMLNIAPATIRTQLFRAKKILKNKLENYLNNENQKLENNKEKSSVSEFVK